MSVGRLASLNGFNDTRVELAGKIVGQTATAWRFDDGIGRRWLPKRHAKWRALRDGYGVMTVPSWLAQRPKFRLTSR